MALYTFEKNKEMFVRATKVIPSGISGNKNPAFAVPGSFPYFAERGEGCRYWDVDGNEYIDFLCGYGPIVLGYGYRAIDEAADRQRQLGSAFNHPTPRSVELAEKLVSLVNGADWAAFGRNGSDVTSYAIQTAREHTQKRKIIMARGAYHGSHAWCTPGHGGLIEEDQQQILQFTWNRADELEALLVKFEGDVAGVILTPYHHPAFGDSELPAKGFWPEVRRLCDKFGVVLICDDVRAGFRLDMAGSSAYFGFEPDLTTFCKAIANGYSISAIVGREPFKNAASNVFFTGTYYTAAVEIAAALACLDELERVQAIPHMMRMGTLFQEGLAERARKHGLQVRVSGPPTLPSMTFANERDYRRMQLFSGECARRGVLLHPHHNWFISYAHKEADIKQALDVTDEVFGVVKAQFGG